MRLAIICGLIFSFANCFATGSVKLTSDRLLSVADGKSTVTISAEVRDGSGKKVADGTVVRFSSSDGSFRESDAITTAGVARAVLVAPEQPGIVKITAVASSVGTVATFDLEFVKDRSMLVAMRQFVEAIGSEYLAYYPEISIISATGKGKGARVKYRDSIIEADDLQVGAYDLEVVAWEATLTVADKKIECKRLRYNLLRRRGSAIMTIDGRTGFFKIVAGEPTLSDKGMEPAEFEFKDTGLANNSIHADRIVNFPGRELQIMRARVYMGDTRVMSIPMYSIKPGAGPNVLGEQIISYQNGGVVLNYPYYVKLSPGQTSLFRLRSGADYGRGSAGSNGIFVDWENTYMSGDSAEGAITLSGIGRKDMGLSWRHTQKLSDSTNASAYVDFPSFKSIYGSASVMHDMPGYTLSFNGSSTKSFRGLRQESQRFDVSLRADQKLIKGTPFNYTYGLSASSTNAIYGNNEQKQEGVGAFAAANLLPQPLWTGTNLNASLSITQLWGSRENTGLGIVGRVGINSSLGSYGSMQLSYDYTQDAFLSSLTGKHRVTGSWSIEGNRFFLSLYGSKSLDVDSATIFADTEYSISKLWHLGSSFSMDRYQSDTVTDTLVYFSYTFGNRDFGITYSLENRRFGFQLMNARFR